MATRSDKKVVEGQSGCCKLVDGTMIQYGTKLCSSGDNSVSFSPAFTLEPTIMITQMNPSTSNIVYLKSLDTNGCVFNAASSVYVKWLAIGWRK